MIYEEFQRARIEEGPYEGPDVFIDRDNTAWGYADRPDQHREDLAVYRLYRQVHEHNDGALGIGDDRVWIVCCKVPNQENFGTRCADLVGLRPDGSIVVFECKVGSNRSDSPLYGLLEGMDYLCHLLIDQNFGRFTEGLDQWRLQHGEEGVRSHTPDGFENVVPVSNKRHGVIVLAPRDYYEVHRLDAQGIEQDWHLLSDRVWPDANRFVDIDFWEHEFLPDGEPSFTAKPLLL